MSVSYSAPTFEPENLEKQIDELDDEAKEERHRDLYGAAVAIEETCKMIDKSLEKLQAELDAVDPGEKEAFLRATELCPEHTKSLQLPFLRSEKFNSQKAAKRVVTYWEEKLRLFGEDNTFKAVTERDIGENGRQVLLGGGCQLLPKDEHGRAVFHANRGSIGRKRNGRDGVLRALFYLLHVAMENDVSVQQKGIVFLSASRYESKVEDYDRIMMKKAYHMMSYVPIRYVGYHVVYSSSFLSFFLPPLLWLMGPDLRSRYIPHHTGQVNRLTQYGLTQLPVECGGTIGSRNEAFLEERRKIEELRDK